MRCESGVRKWAINHVIIAITNRYLTAVGKGLCFDLTEVGKGLRFDLITQMPTPEDDLIYIEMPSQQADAFAKATSVTKIVS